MSGPASEVERGLSPGLEARLWDPCREAAQTFPTRGRQRPGSRFGKGGHLVPPPPRPSLPASPLRAPPGSDGSGPDFEHRPLRGRLGSPRDPRPARRPVQPPARPIGEWPPAAAAASQLGMNPLLP